MTSHAETGDTVEKILNTVLSASAGVSPAPREYFLLSNASKSQSWVLGFLFETAGNLRTALEDGVCFWLHSYTSELLASSKALTNLEHYIVFDIGSAPVSDKEQQDLFQVHYERLQAMQNEGGDIEKPTCGICGHSIDEHQMRGYTEEGEVAPTQGWMIGPDEHCVCFRTWSLGGS